MNLWVPYTELQPATRICLLPYAPQYVEITSDDGYLAYFRERWAVRNAFVNVEHDVVFWPGALEGLWDCPEPWCGYAYHLNDKPYFGCVKFSAEVIQRLPDVWADDVSWLELDLHFERAATAAGISVHQHHPGVVNANPVLLAGR